MSRPRLVILSGASGSGKSTLAPGLASALDLPLLAKDDVKEALYDTLGVPPDRDASRRLGMAAYVVLYRLAERLLDSGPGALVECNFWRGMAEREVGPLVGRARSAIVHCTAPREVLVRRQLARASGAAPRHAGHLAHTDAAALTALLERPEELSARVWPDEEPMELGVPVLRVDTTDGLRPGLEEIAAWVQAAARA